MRVLLDTHALLWWGAHSALLSERAREAIRAEENVVFLSVVSAWEMQVKAQIGKLRLHRALPEFIAEQQAANGFEMLPVAFRHVYALDRLPLHHRDPFDRLLIAQALAEDLAVVSHDARFASYPVRVVW